MAAVDEERKGETRTGRRGLPNIGVLPSGWIPLIKPHNGLLTHLYICSFIQQLTTGTLFVPGAVVTAGYAVEPNRHGPCLPAAYSSELRRVVWWPLAMGGYLNLN